MTLLTYDYVKSFIEGDEGNGCKLKSKKYIKCTSKLIIQCKCTRVFEKSFQAFKYKNQRQCNECAKINGLDKRMQSEGFWSRKRSTEKYKQQVFEAVGNEYEILGEYIDIKKPINIKHNICGNIYLKSPDNFLIKGKRCPYCSGRMKKNTDSFKKDVSDVVGNEYTVLGEYKNNRTNILIRHNICSTEYNVTPHNFLRGRRCSVCNESKGEQFIRKYLYTNNLKFISQYEIAECRDKNPLPFDFVILNFDNSIKYLIEYDGEFHHLPLFGKTHFYYLKRHDEIKDKYCRENNIKLIRIPYWEYDNIVNILETQSIGL